MTTKPDRERQLRLIKFLKNQLEKKRVLLAEATTDLVERDEENRITVGEMKLGSADFSQMEAQALAYLAGLGMPTWFQRWLKPASPNNMFAQFMQKIVDK